MRITKKRFVLLLKVLSRNIKCVYSFCAVSQTQPPKLGNLKQTRLGLHWIWGKMRILLFLKISQTCWIILDSSSFPASNSGPDSFTETLVSAPGSCQAPGKSQMAPGTALEDHTGIALLPLSVKQLLNLKPSNYMYIMDRHMRQRKTFLCVHRQQGETLLILALLYLAHNSFYCCSLDSQQLHSAFIIFTFNTRLCHQGQATLTVML